MRQFDLSGCWKIILQDENTVQYEARLPGTLDENEIGHADENREQWHPDVALTEAETDASAGSKITTRLTRRYSYTGIAAFTRSFVWENDPQNRVLLEIERSRKLSATMNGVPVHPRCPGTLSTPWVFEVTSHLHSGRNACTLFCDNAYTGWPYREIVYSSAATDETQTNWNGILGYLRLRVERKTFLSAIRVIPYDEKKLRIFVELDSLEGFSGTLKISSPAFREDLVREVSVSGGTHGMELFYTGGLQETCRFWDEGEGILYPLTVSGDGLESKTVLFGLRQFSGETGRLTLNGRPIFLRCETNCCVFPETGHMPMEKKAWRSILQQYMDYGVNCVRFHSHCPPEAAFAAADELGMLIQPELSHWNAKNAFESEESWNYYSQELEAILREYANHPSFVMFSFGNELHAGALGHQRMESLLQKAKTLDPSRLYANASNAHYGALGPDVSSDFYTSANCRKNTMIRGTSEEMAGHLNQSYPSSQTDYSRELQELRKRYSKPVFSFEVGQYEILPDFSELDAYQGVTRPDNLQIFADQAREKGLLDHWKQLAQASAALSMLAYREEVEAAARTPEMSGISLLGLQDFPGQGTALVGMLDAHLQPKPYPYTQPAAFRAFFSDCMLLLLLPKFTYSCGESIPVRVKLANYGKTDLSDVCTVTLSQNGNPLCTAALKNVCCPCGALTLIGDTEIHTNGASRADRLVLTAAFAGHETAYSVWVYPKQERVVPTKTLVTQSPEEARQALKAGKRVFLSPPATESDFPNSISAQFTTDFWSVATFPKQSGFMGLLIDAGHPALQEFPTDTHSDWQWWAMCRGRSMLLPPSIDPIITGISCCLRMQKMGLLVEACVENGKLMLSSMGLLENLQYPEVTALLNSILRYMDSDAFQPAQTLQNLDELVR